MKPLLGTKSSPSGSGLTALHARVEELTRNKLETAVAEDRTLLQSWCMRGAPFYSPTADLDTFSAGALPRTEKSLRHFVLWVEQSVDDLGLELGELVSMAEGAINEILRGRQMTIIELGEELAAEMADSLTGGQRKIWVKEGPYAENQSLGEGVVHFCIRILTLRQVLWFAPREGNTAPFVPSKSGWASRRDRATLTSTNRRSTPPARTCCDVICTATGLRHERISLPGSGSSPPRRHPGGICSMTN